MNYTLNQYGSLILGKGRSCFDHLSFEFNNANIKIVTNSVNSIALSSENKSKLSTQSLSQLKDFKSQLSDSQLIKSFYNLLR